MDFEALERLAIKAENEAKERATGKRKPSWGMFVEIDEELAGLLRELEWLKPDEKPIVRIWADFCEPKYGTVCRAFKVRAGRSASGDRLFVASRGRNGSWRAGLTWNEPTAKHSESWHRRYPLAVRATELAGEVLGRFAGNPDEIAKLGARVAGACLYCSRELTDAVSVSIGIGPECRGEKTKTHAKAPPSEPKTEQKTDGERLLEAVRALAERSTEEEDEDDEDWFEEDEDEEDEASGSDEQGYDRGYQEGTNRVLRAINPAVDLIKASGAQAKECADMLGFDCGSRTAENDLVNVLNACKDDALLSTLALAIFCANQAPDGLQLKDHLVKFITSK